MYTLGSFPLEKTDFYKQLNEALASLLDPSLPWSANLANAGALLYWALIDPPHERKINWTGFYLLKENTLILGPFQGRIACTKIPVGKGVCGTVAAQKKALIVPDVHQFSGHIACDSASQSEIVIPILVKDSLVGVLDIDALVTNAFDEQDQVGLTGFAQTLAGVWPLE